MPSDRAIVAWRCDHLDFEPGHQPRFCGRGAPYLRLLAGPSAAGWSAGVLDRTPSSEHVRAPGHPAPEHPCRQVAGTDPVVPRAAARWAALDPRVVLTYARGSSTAGEQDWCMTCDAPVRVGVDGVLRRHRPGGDLYRRRADEDDGDGCCPGRSGQGHRITSRVDSVVVRAPTWRVLYEDGKAAGRWVAVDGRWIPASDAELKAYVRSGSRS